MKKYGFVIIVLAAAALAGCYGNSSSNSPTASGSTSPTKDAAVQLLRALNSAIEAKDYSKAMGYVQGPARNEDFDRLVANQEISARGIDILAEKGKWGKLTEVFDSTRASGWADRVKVPVDSCYGLNYQNAEAGFYLDGKQFKIIRCDDIGKLN
jgi:hypothetical protein